MNSKSFNALQDFYQACSEFYEGKIELAAWRSSWESLRGAEEEERVYPCASPDCKVMRSKAEGGTVFTVCDKHWDEGHPDPTDKPEHAKTCSELVPFKCCACGQECCTKHGMPLLSSSKWKVEGNGSRRCTPCADAERG